MSRDELTLDELQVLVEVAERSVHIAVIERRTWYPDPDEHPSALREPGAAFVTLRRAGRLMGCIGTMAALDPLVVTVADRARAAALDDPRFPGITASDLPELDVSVSVLSPMEPIPVRDYEELLVTIRPGIDGLLVDAGYHRATFLPSVWDELADPATFVEALWRKAGLAPAVWPAATRISRYTAQHAQRE